jgi:5'-nucleotidase / UDP-sugar diphosphatase
VAPRSAFLFVLLFAGTSLLRGAGPRGSEALCILIGDQHSAYDHAAQFVLHVDRLHTENPGVPLAIFIDGDVFERGNAIALRTKGEIDFALLAALARRAPTVLNIGNHEPEFYPLPELVRRVEATGVKVVSNAVDRGSGQPVAPASLRIHLGKHELTVVGLTTDRLATYPPFVREALHIPDPVDWATDQVPKLLAGADIAVVLSHAGVVVDRQWLPVAPNRTLVAGAHDHLRLVHRERDTVYVHSGSWGEYVTNAWLCPDDKGVLSWEIEQTPISPSSRPDPDLAAIIHSVVEKNASAADRAVVGHSRMGYPPIQAEQFVTAAVRNAAHVDAAFIGHTTFGAGLPAGDVTQLAFDACVRFDGTIFTGEIDGARLRELMAHANESFDTPWTERHGDYLVAAGPATIVPEKRYTIAVTDWIARNSGQYLGATIPLTKQPALRLKVIAAAALQTK